MNEQSHKPFDLWDAWALTSVIVVLCLAAYGFVRLFI